MPNESPSTSGRVTVPNVVGTTSSAALQILARGGLGLETVPERSATVPSGVIIAESPRAGQSVPQFTRVSLYVSSGPDGITDGTPPSGNQPTTTVTIPVSSTAPHGSGA